MIAAVAESAPAVARTLPDPTVVLAVNKPLEETVPPVAVQVTVGELAIVCPNWSSPATVNCRVCPVCTEAVPGVTCRLVSVALTVTRSLRVIPELVKFRS